MARPLRFLPPECPLVEVTCRTIHGRLLLRPSKSLNAIALGVLARSARRYAMPVCAFSFLSNHYHLLLRPRSATHLSDFMSYFNGNLAKEAGRLHRWRDKFWGRRYKPIPVSDEPEAQITRLRYLMEQGCKENLVARPEQWPGAHSVTALRTGTKVVGVWYDRTSAYRARRLGKSVSTDDFASEEELELAVLPCWEALSQDERQALVEELRREIIKEAAEKRRKTGKRPLGRRAILRQDPRSLPRRTERSPAPRFHAADFRVRSRLEALYRAFLDARADAMDALRRGRSPIRFPEHGIPPPHLRTFIAA